MKRHLFLFALVLFAAARPAGAGLWCAAAELLSMSDGLSSVSHAVFQNVHHLEWCTKYRYRTFNSVELINACEASIRRAAQRHGVQLLELSVMPEHVHCVAQFRPSLSVSSALALLKGASARELLKAFPQLRKRYWGGHLWSAGRFSRSVGDVGVDVVRHYVKYDNDSRQRKLAAYQNPTLAEGESQPKGLAL